METVYYVITQASNSSNLVKDKCEEDSALVCFLSLIFPCQQQNSDVLIGHGTRGSVAFAAQDVDSGELLVVCQWLIKCPMPRRKGSLDASLNPELAALLKQVSAVANQ